MSFRQTTTVASVALATFLAGGALARAAGAVEESALEAPFLYLSSSASMTASTSGCSSSPSAAARTCRATSARSCLLPGG